MSSASSSASRISGASGPAASSPADAAPAGSLAAALAEVLADVRIAPLGRAIAPLLRRPISSARGSSVQLCARPWPTVVGTSSSELTTWPLSSSHGSGRSPNCLHMYAASDDGDAVSPALAAK